MKNPLKKARRCLALYAVLPLALLTACIGGKAMEVTYTVRSAAVLKDYTIFLVVNDKRSTNDLVGPAAREKGLFEELKGGRFDLKVTQPNGSTVIETNLAAPEAVQVATSRRLQSQGVTATNLRAAAQLTMEVNIEQMNIDLSGSDLVATVALSTAIYRDATGVAKSNTTATANRMKIIGGTGGATVLSEALSQALNDLDFSGVNRF
ncbi:MAG: hypothetical protein LBP55_01765 [Candidatus Adiutrix sp.]|jgi:hypothetical protein|nr:hypothetical protein [Candidatus Adiutrix sp.]